MEITSLSLSLDKTELTIEIDDASLVNSFYLFTEDTYKNYSLAVDLMSNVSGQTTESVVLLASDLGLAFFDGLYFIEVIDPNTISTKLIPSLLRYEECILNKVLKINKCDDCLKEKSLPLINAQTTLEGLKIASANGFVQEAINLINNLKRYCSEKCKSCGDYNNLINTTYLSYNDQ
jgi:hypothetical protein